MSVSEQIIQVINALCEKFGIVVDWTSKNAIPYLEVLCKKLITYEIWTSVMDIIVSLTLSFILIFLIKKFYPIFRDGCKQNLKTYDCGWIIASVFTIIGLVIFYIAAAYAIFYQVEDILKCIIFPELYVFEYINALITA